MSPLSATISLTFTIYGTLLLINKGEGTDFGDDYAPTIADMHGKDDMIRKYWHLRNHAVGIKSHYVVFDLVFYLKEDKWVAQFHGLAYKLELGKRSFKDNLYYYGKLFIEMQFTLNDIAYLLDAVPLVGRLDIPSFHWRKAQLPIKHVNVEDDAYFTEDLILHHNYVENEIGSYTSGEIVFTVQFPESVPYHLDTFFVRSTGTSIIVVWGAAMYSNEERWSVINSDTDLVRMYSGPDWFADAYRYIQIKYNAMISYVCPQPMQMFESIKHFLRTKKFPKGPLFMIRHFHPRVENVLQHVTTRQDRNLFIIKSIEDAMIKAPLKKFILIGSVEEDMELFVEIYRLYSKRIRHIFLYNRKRLIRNSDNTFNTIRKVVKPELWTLFSQRTDTTIELKDIFVDETVEQAIFAPQSTIETGIKATKFRSRLMLVIACCMAGLCLIPLVLVVLYWYGLLDNLAGRQTFASTAYKRMSATKEAIARQSTLFFDRASKLLRGSGDEGNDDD